jgi:hypothetical protein
MKIEAFLSDDEMKDVKSFIKELMKSKQRSRSVGSGGLIVEVERRDDKNGWLFSINRTIAFVTVPKKEKDGKR